MSWNYHLTLQWENESCIMNFDQPSLECTVSSNLGVNLGAFQVERFSAFACATEELLNFEILTNCFRYSFYSLYYSLFP